MLITHLTVICVTTSEFKIANIDAINEYVAKYIVVVDGSEFESLATDGKFQILKLQGLNGSYYARNRGLELAGKGQVLLLDDDVEVVSLPTSLPEPKQLIVPIVNFRGAPATLLQNWYYVNAFDQEKFVSSGFAPTICWLFNSAGDTFSELLFDENLYSGGDVKAAKKMLKITLDRSFVVTTSLRSSEKIKTKFKRQAVGHVLLIREKYGLAANIVSLVYILKNILLANGLHNLSKSKFKLRYIRSCYLAGFLKAGSHLIAMFSSNKRLNVLAVSINKIENSH